MQPYKVITGPAAEPLTLEHVRRHLRLPGAFDSPPATHHMDSNLVRWIRSARESAEAYTGRVLCPQTIEITRDSFDGDIELPPPVISITSVTYVDTDGASQTMPSTDYALDDRSEPAYLVRAYGATWPSTNRVNAVKVRLDAGYSIPGDSPQTHPLPVPLESAMLLIVEWLYEGAIGLPHRLGGVGETLEDFMGRTGLRMWRLELGFA